MLTAEIINDIHIITKDITKMYDDFFSAGIEIKSTGFYFYKGKIEGYRIYKGCDDLNKKHLNIINKKKYDFLIDLTEEINDYKNRKYSAELTEKIIFNKMMNEIEKIFNRARGIEKIKEL